MKKKELVKFLSSKNVETDLISKIKIAYRPYVCPFDEILELIGENKMVFDIGCGSGMLLALIAEYQKPKKLGGLEISQNLVDNAVALLEDYSVPAVISLQNGQDFPEEIKNYDFITMIDVLHHVPQKLQMDYLKNLLDKMKKGSRLIFKDIDASSPLIIFNRMHDLIFAKQFVHEKSYNEILQFFKDNNLEIEISYKKRMLYFPHFLIMVKK
jgi:cyclopropane fatty-acyl-phospholipid synthase-like methyltransferase